MKYNRNNIWIPLVTILLAGASYLLGRCGVIRTCIGHPLLKEYSLSVFEPIVLYSLAVLPLSLFLLFVRGERLKRWFRFAGWWLPLSILGIAIAPESSHTWMPLYPEPTKENLACLMGALFTVISIALLMRGTKRTAH